MPDVKKIAKLQPRHWDRAAEYINQEYQRRKEDSKRVEKVRIWDEVDRQVEMKPKPRKIETGKKTDWFPNTELSLQATALEVLQADARRLTFPRNAEWFVVHSETSDSYVRRFQDRRENFPLIGDSEVPVKLDQETADILVKATLDHFHKVFNFRQSADFFDVEALKYGTYAGRVVEATLPIFRSGFKGVSLQNIVGPAMIPISVRNLFLDDTAQAVMAEGVAISPSPIRRYWQRRDDMKLAAKKDSTWLKSQVANIQLKKPEIPVLVLEFEGDLTIPNSQSSFFLPNVTVTVAIGEDKPRVVRFRPNKGGRRTYFHGVYQKEDLKSPYGSSPLMKGQPIQELATLMANQLAAVGALSAEPPILYDASDTQMKSAGGPTIFPGSLMETDDPSTVEILNEWSIGEIAAALAMILQQYEDLTGVTAPRRGAQTKSHTTAFAVDVENTRGLVRTDDYIQDKEIGVLTTILNMEFDIIKSVMKRQPVLINTAGIEGFAMIGKEDLADHVVFDVIGSAGPATERERRAERIQALQSAASFSQLSAPQGGPQLNFDEAMKEILDVFPNPDRFITAPQGVPNAAGGVGGPQPPPRVVSGT